MFGSDTLYGFHASALSSKAVERIYTLKERDPEKPFIVLISNFKQLKNFGVNIPNEALKVVKKSWPGKLTVILPCEKDEFNYIHRGKKSIAFRMPDKKILQEIIDKTGPLVSTTVNKQGNEPAKSITEAKKWFGNKVDFYIDEGKLSAEPSTIIEIKDNQINILRQGAVKLHDIETASRKRYHLSMNKNVNFLLAGIILAAVSVGVYSNIREQRNVDHSKIPEKVEMSKGFQRWVTNIKNKELPIDADQFRLREENEVYNSKWILVYSIEAPGMQEIFNKTLQAVQDTRGVVFSPSDREFIDYRNTVRGDYAPNEVHFYGLKEDKIIDARILNCSVYANCYFDRAYFLDNDVFVISEFSRNIDKKDTTSPACPVDQSCTYTIKLHVIDLINNKRSVYESKPFDAILSTLIPHL